MTKIFGQFKYFDIPLLAAGVLLILTGLALLYSTTLTTESVQTVWRQLSFVIFGLAGFLFFSFYDYHNLSKANRVFYVVLILILLYLLILGPEIRGGRRWIDFGYFTFQPAEFVKISIILGLARLLYLKRGQINSLKILGWSLLYALIPITMIILEPDLGSALVILAIWAGIILSSPIQKKFVAILLLGFILASGVAWQFLLKDFQKDRIMVFLNPELDPRGRGYNVRQATIAVGSGQLFGKGLGKGSQSQYKFLPERQTDFIFAASSEEIGFLGSIALLGMYFFLFARIIKIAKKARDDLGMYIAIGVFVMLLSHTLVNIGMNIGLLPVTGIPLPFLSAGGSFLIVTLLALGVVQNVAVQSKILRF